MSRNEIKYKCKFYLIQALKEEAFWPVCVDLDFIQFALQ